MLGLASLVWGAGSAAAGQYTVWSCRGPQGEPISTAAWRTEIEDAVPGDLEIVDDCAAGGSLRVKVTDAGISANRKPRGEAVFRLPRGAVISGFKMWRYVVAAASAGSGYAYAAATTELDGGSSFDFGCASSFYRPSFVCSWLGGPAEPLTAENLVVQRSSPLTGLRFWAACVKVGCKPPIQPPSAEFQMFRSAVSIEDDQAPTVVRLRGGLAESAPVSGVSSLFVAAADDGGGVAAFQFSVDGGAPRWVTVANGRGGCEEPFWAPRPCPTTAARSFSLDTAALAPGGHTVSGAVIDAAGNATRFGPLTFTVAAREHGRPVVPPKVVEPRGVTVVASKAPGPNNGTPAVVTPRLRVKRTVAPRRIGKPGRVRGSLRTPAGRPIAGARLRVAITQLGGGRRGKSRTVRTDAHGRFSFKVGGAGARSVVVSYSPRLGGPVSRTARAMVLSPLSLRLTGRPRRVRNRRRVHFVGRLRGAGRAARGATVEIQAIADGRWKTVKTATTRAHGRFRWTHRFRYVERDALFSFRAVVRRTPGWPWATVRSPRVKVRIKGVPR